MMGKIMYFPHFFCGVSIGTTRIRCTYKTVSISISKRKNTIINVLLFLIEGVILNELLEWMVASVLM